MTTRKHMQYQEMQKQYLRKRQDEIWKTVRLLTNRSRVPLADRQRTDQPERSHTRDIRSERRG